MTVIPQVNRHFATLPFRLLSQSYDCGSDLFFGNVYRVGVDFEEPFCPAVGLVGVAGSGDFVLTAVREFKQVVFLQWQVFAVIGAEVMFVGG